MRGPGTTPPWREAWPRATGRGEAEKLVTEGVKREKAGKPEKSEIDSAFSDLTTETGKDWLAFYRRRAQR